MERRKINIPTAVLIFFLISVLSCKSGNNAAEQYLIDGVAYKPIPGLTTSQLDMKMMGLSINRPVTNKRKITEWFASSNLFNEIFSVSVKQVDPEKILLIKAEAIYPDGYTERVNHFLSMVAIYPFGYNDEKNNAAYRWLDKHIQNGGDTTMFGVNISYSVKPNYHLVIIKAE